MSLVGPFVELRSPLGLSKSITGKIKITLGETRDEVYDSSELCIYPSQSAKKRRCEVCVDEAVGHGSKRDNLGRILSQCQRCGKAVCQRHFFRFCESCQ